MAFFENIPGTKITAGDSAQITLSGTITGVVGDANATLEAAANFPAYYGGLRRSALSVTETAPDIWECEAQYTKKDAPKNEPTTQSDPSTSDPASWSVSLDFGSGTQHITQAKQHVASYVDASDPFAIAPDHGGAIGVNDGDVAGCDIVIPQPTWTETHQIAATSFTSSRRRAILKLIGKTNNAPFRECAAGEVLFMGASATRNANTSELFEVSFRFSYSEHVANQTIGGIDGITKCGWDYLWVEYARSVDDDTKKKVAQPIAVHVERVYDSGSFAALGIGTT